MGRPTFELVALLEVEHLDLHALEYLDVAWGSGGEGKRWGEMKKVPGEVLQVRPWGLTPNISAVCPTYIPVS